MTAAQQAVAPDANRCFTVLREPCFVASRLAPVNRKAVGLTTFRMNPPNDDALAAFFRLHEHVRFLHAYWDTFRSLYRAPAEKQELLRTSVPQFFVLLEKGLIRLIFLMFRQLVEQPVTMGRRNASLRGLLEAVDGAAYKSGAEEQLVKTIEQNNTIKEHVNRVVAHIDWNVAVGDDAPPGPIALSEIEDALENVRAVMRHIATQLKQPVLDYRDAHIREEIERMWVLLASPLEGQQPNSR